MILELCTGVHRVDLGESFQTRTYLQKLASVQPRTSPRKFARSSNAAAERARADVLGDIDADFRNEILLGLQEGERIS